MRVGSFSFLTVRVIRYKVRSSRITKPERRGVGEEIHIPAYKALLLFLKLEG